MRVISDYINAEYDTDAVVFKLIDHFNKSMVFIKEKLTNLNEFDYSVYHFVNSLINWIGLLKN